MYKTDCPKCGHDVLHVEGTARFYNVPLEPDGYTDDNGSYEVIDLTVTCPKCAATFYLSELEDDSIFPQTLRCKNPLCGKTFGSDEATYCYHIDSYLCPYCGGTDVS